MPKNWNRRFKYNRDKMKTGDIFELAEVVRNLSLRDQEKGLSTGEKQMFVKAKKILASELMYAKGMDEDEAASGSTTCSSRSTAGRRRPGALGPVRTATCRPCRQASFAGAHLSRRRPVCGPRRARRLRWKATTRRRARTPRLPSPPSRRRSPPAIKHRPTCRGARLRPDGRAQEGPNWVDLALVRTTPFAEYRTDPERREQIVAASVDEARQRLDEGIAQTCFGDVRRDR